MGRKKRKKAGAAAWLLLAVLAFLPALYVRAEQGNGSVRVAGLPAEAAGAELTLYRVADMNGVEYSYGSGAFAGCGVSLEGLDTAQDVRRAADQLADWAGAHGISGTPGRPDGSGTVSWTGLSSGLYLVVQTGGTDRVDIQKALVSVPGVLDGEVRYDVEIDAKYVVYTEPQPRGAVVLDKTDDEGTPLAGVTFQLQRKTYVSQDREIPEGTETGSDGGGRFYWQDIGEPLVTDGNGQVRADGLEAGSEAFYRFVEKAAPEGYVMRTDFPFTLERAETVEVDAVNPRTLVRVNKVDEEGNGVAGAALVILDGQGNPINKEDGTPRWAFATTGEPYEIRGIPAGDYLLRETAAPGGYDVAADVPFTVTGETDEPVVVTMVDEGTEPSEGTLSVTKHARLLSGEDMTLVDRTFYVRLFLDEERTQPASNVIPMEFVNASSQTVTFTGLALDTAYYVSETDEAGNPIDNGTTEDGGVYGAVFADGNRVELTAQAPEGTVEFENAFSEPGRDYYIEGNLTITKRVVSGGSLTDSNGTFYAGIFEDPQHTVLYGDVVELFMDGSSELSVEVPVEIGTNPGDSRTFYVTETDKDGVPVEGSPDFAYKVTVDKTEVTLTGEQDTASVVITNERKDGKGSLSVTKALKTLSGEELVPREAVFYTALFADEARTQRVSDVLALEYQNASSQTVTFENLDLNTVYYVSETDEAGNPVDNGTAGEDGVYGAVFPDGNTVELTEAAPEKAVSFENVFSDIPRDYYMEGELTITKRVLRNGALAGTSEIFYAGIFEDAEHTRLYGSVIALPMGGDSEYSVTVPVEIGNQPGDKKTYYVTETDADGVPVAGSASFAYAVSVDKTSVTLSGEDDRGTVVITNATTESPGIGSIPTDSVRTGDETPIGLYIAVFAGSAVVLLGLLIFFVVRRWKRTR